MTKELLHKFFNNTCTPEEAAEVAAYLEAGDRGVLDEYIDWLAEKSEQLPARLSTEESAELLEAIHAGNKNGNDQSNIAAMPGRWWTPVKVAASVALLLVSAAAVYFIAQRPGTQVQPVASTILLANHSNKVKRIALPDGTAVWLNSESSLTYDRQLYNQKDRTVKIEGEVFFDVSHNPQKPFHVQAGDVSTTVLGTAFNIEAYPGEKNTRVTLLRGKVGVNANANQFILSPGQRMTYSHNNHKMDVSNVETDGTADWINGTLVFDDLPLTDVLKRVEMAFAIHITCRTPGLLENKYLAGTYSQDDPASVLKKILFIHDLKFTRKGNEYTIIP